MPDLSERIRYLVETVEQPVTLSEVRDILERRPGRRRRPRLAFAATSVVVAAAAIVAGIVFVPASHGHTPVTAAPPQTAAVQLQEIALTAGRQPVVAPGPNQWLHTEQAMSIAAYVSQVGATPTPDAKATLSATIGTWSDTTGQACISAATDPAQFAGPANQAAWTAAGLIDQPADQPVTGCDGIIQGDTVGTLTQATGVIDVSYLPTDSATLAGELNAGTTGVPAVDGVVAMAGASTAFARAAILLVGPDSGVTPAFEAALYGALATIPGVDSLGRATTHSGRTGVGFSAITSLGTTTIVIDPSTGALLEARNVADQATFNVLSIHYLAPRQELGHGIGSQGGSYGATVLWLDPIREPMVVGPFTQLTEGDVAIYTIARTDVTFEQVDALDVMLQHQIGGIASIQGSGSTANVTNSNVPPATTPNGQVINIGATNTWTFTGSSKQVRDSLAALQASGLFATILVF
jgi:hypothetical protein